MFRKSFFATSLVLTLAATGLAQVAGSSSPRAATSNKGQTTSTPATSAHAATRPAQTGTLQTRAVREAFDSLVDGIRRTDAEAVMKLYWNSPQLSIFNNNGTVTRGWEQAHSNRVSLYEKTKDVKLDVRDVRVKTLGPSAAIVTCLWDQTQTSGGQPEHATGRLTLVYQKIGTDWKIVHTHTSPDKPDPSNLLPSERVPQTDATPAKPEGDATPARPPAKPETNKTPVKPRARR